MSRDLAGPIFLTIIQIAVSADHILLICVAYLISVVLYQCLRRILLHFRKGTFALSAPQMKAGGVLAPLCPPLPRPSTYHILQASLNPRKLSVICLVAYFNEVNNSWSL